MIFQSSQADMQSIDFIEAQARALELEAGNQNREFIEALSRALMLDAARLPEPDETRKARLLEALTGNLIGAQDFIQGLLDQVDWGFKTSNGDVSYSLAFSILRTPGMAWAGYLALGKISARRRLWAMAYDCFKRCDDDILIRYQPANAIEAFARADDDRARTLIVRAGAEAVVDTATAFRLAAFAAMYGMRETFETIAARDFQGPEPDETQRARWAYLRSAFDEQERIGHQLGTIGFAETFAAAAWSGFPLDFQQQGPVRVGLFDYRNPTFPSNNIGDYVQTVAVASQLGQFDYAELEAADPVRAVITRRTSPAAAPRVDRPVEIVPVNRDFSLTSLDGEGPIWLPVCGWFAHQPYFFGPTLPFARHIIPIFMSFHLARPEQLTETVADYLRAHEPIGCRDMLTVRFLRDRGIEAFFNGCVTLSLGATFTPFEGQRNGQYVGQYSSSASLPHGFTSIAHLDIETWGRSFSENMSLAVDLLDTYRTAEAVRTPLLHCLLPSRAMGTPVEFTHPKLSDPRFEGLVDADEEERARIVSRFEEKFCGVMARVFEGADRDDVFATWRELCRPDIEETNRRLAAVAPSPWSGTDESLDLSACKPTAFGPDAPNGEGKTIDLVFCFDKNFIEYFGPTLLSVTRNTQRPLRAHLICRNVTPETIAEISKLFPQVAFVLYDVGAVSYGNVKLLSHISVSTMDRLVSPELLSGVSRAVYLDLDILVRGDVGDLADFDLQGNAIAARDSIHEEWKSGRSLVYEIAKRFEADKARAFRAFMFDGGKVEFEAYNAGILVMDLEALRADSFSEKAVSWAKEFELHDQFILNIYTRERRAKLPPSWNHFATQENIDDPKLVHFIGTIKPWTAARRHPFDTEWLACKEAYLNMQHELADRIE